ncbi:MAG TPA: nuclear transport factor 2 family protein [Methylomirabilota bacterium]|nr:nuclear transport factor 2 family protein [Methylomirabilota bacterium]
MTHPRSTTRATVERLLAVIATADHDALTTLYANHVDFRVNWPESEIGGAVPWIRTRATNSDMVEHFRAIVAHNRPSGEGATVDRILVDGPDAVVLGTIRSVIAANGRAYEARFALHLTVEGGRINRHHVYEDSLAVWRAWSAT